jgi:hypothetical protein
MDQSAVCPVDQRIDPRQPGHSQDYVKVVLLQRHDGEINRLGVVAQPELKLLHTHA